MVCHPFVEPIELRDAERVYVNGILQNGLESGNNKPFWKYVKYQKQESFGISALKSNGNVITDSLSKAEILNSQFKSVFTPQSGNTFPQLPGTKFPKIKPLHISENGVFMLLDRIDQSHLDQTSFLEYTLSLPNHFVLANYLLNGHKLMLHRFFRKALSYRQ